MVGAQRAAGPASPGDDLAADRRLAARICAGDDEAFAELVRSHHGLVARTSGRFFRRPEVVEEVVQEVFVKAFRAMPGYRGDVAIGWWLKRITVNACYDELLGIWDRTAAKIRTVLNERQRERFDALAAARRGPLEHLLSAEQPVPPPPPTPVESEP